MHVVQLSPSVLAILYVRAEQQCKGQELRSEQRITWGRPVSWLAIPWLTIAGLRLAKVTTVALLIWVALPTIVLLP